MDGYPKSLLDAKKVFMVREEDGLPDIKQFEYPVPVVEEEEEEEEVDPKKKGDKKAKEVKKVEEV